jgi:hypothetical protein
MAPRASSDDNSQSWPGGGQLEAQHMSLVTGDSEVRGRGAGTVLPPGVAPPPPSGLASMRRRVRLPCPLPGTRALVASAQPWRAGAFCTGGRPTPRVSAHLPPLALSTRLPAAGKPRCCAARRARCWTLLPTGKAGCCLRRWPLGESSEPRARRNREQTSEARPRD